MTSNSALSSIIAPAAETICIVPCRSRARISSSSAPRSFAPTNSSRRMPSGSISSRSTLSSVRRRHIHRLAVVGEDDLEARLGGDRLAADARHGLDHDELPLRLVVAEDAKVGDEPDVAGPVARRLPRLGGNDAARRADHLDALDQRGPAVARHIDHIVPVHVGDIRHAALPRQPELAARRLGQLEIVGATARVDLRRADDLVRHDAGLVVGRIGVVAAAMGDRRTRIHRLEQRQRHRAGRDIDMAAAERADEEVRRMRRLGEAVGDIAEGRDRAGAGEGLVVEHPRDPHRHQLVGGRRLQARARRCGTVRARPFRPAPSQPAAAPPMELPPAFAARRRASRGRRREFLGCAGSRSHSSGRHEVG